MMREALGTIKFVDRPIEPIYVTIGNNIRRERDALGFTQADLAQEIGLTRTSVVNIEAGRQRMPVHTLCQIAEALGVSVYSLMKGSPMHDPHTLAGERE